jgi:NAD(P)-dependent dehydrogenase (short-subunit alcohol dehydrogenase family)
LFRSDSSLEFPERKGRHQHDEHDDSNHEYSLQFSRRRYRRVATPIGSVVSDLTPPNAVVYTATKGAVDAVTRVLAKELGPRKIRVNSIQSGPHRY